MAKQLKPVDTFGLTHIAMAVRDPERAARFYQAVVGAQPVYQQEDFIQAQTPGTISNKPLLDPYGKFHLPRQTWEVCVFQLPAVAIFVSYPFQRFANCYDGLNGRVDLSSCIFIRGNSILTNRIWKGRSSLNCSTT